jgi:phosphotransferase system  glucose/maltose/N-acetylglucosamine-specific IIC component
MNGSRTVSRAHRWLLVIPFVWQVGFVPVVNDVALRPLGLPFPMVWQMVGIVLTTCVIAVVFALDRRADAAESGGDDPGQR